MTPTTAAPAPVPAPASNSALRHAEQLDLDIAAVQSQFVGLMDLLATMTRDRDAWRKGGIGEQQVLQVVVDMYDAGWYALPDRRWPGTSRANIDLLVVGPGGVFVIDVKAWREPRVEHGRLWRGQEPQDDVESKLLSQVHSVEDVLADVGLPPTEVIPMLVLAGRKTTHAQLGRIAVCGDRDLPRELVRRGCRLATEQVTAILSALEAGCPPYPVEPRRRFRPAGPNRRLTGSVRGPRQHALLDEAEIIHAMLEAAAREPIETWMTWLHPTQARLVAQSFAGPSRIRGAAGTGKTVVALHRARHLAAMNRRVLVTSFVRTLPAVQQSLFRRMAPGLLERVEFTGLHAWAYRLLLSRGLDVHVDGAAVNTCFSLAWSHVGRGGVLSKRSLPLTYWQQEIKSVIKGRGLTSLDQYLALNRVGRGTRLSTADRTAVWTLFVEYERLLVERGIVDWDDLIALALRSVQDQPVSPAYDAVVVDEVQDLSAVGVRLLHALVGDAPDGLTLVGDGQQAVYPGGFTLNECGVSVVGRSTVLRRNYRNAGNIIQAALSVVANDAFDDLEIEQLTGARELDIEREGGRVIRATAADSASQQAALVQHLRDEHEVESVRYADMAVLCPSNAVAAYWASVLDRAGLPTMLLTTYDGYPTDAVKVGTFQRAKGLEFASVFIPDHDRVPSPRRVDELDDAYEERAALERRQLFVAMTRARDSLWLGAWRARPGSAEVTPGSADLAIDLTTDIE